MKTISVLLATATLGVAGLAFADHPRFTYLHQHDDVNRDFRSDVFFRLGTALAYSMMDQDGSTAVASSGVYAGDGGAGYYVVAVSDFDGDGSADVLWSNGSHLKLWINNGSGLYTPVAVGNYGGGWQPFAAGDINGDGRSDLFFRGSTHLAYWLMDGSRVIGSSYAGDGGAGFRVVAIADFTGRNADGSHSADVLWSNGSQLKIWVSDAGTASFQPHAIGSYGGGWEPFAAGDVNADGIADILFRGGTHIAYWRQQGSGTFFNYVSRYAGDGGPGFRAIGVSEYSIRGDSSVDDILWTNGTQLKLWEGTCYGCDDPEYTPLDLGSYGGGWQPLEMLIPRD